MPRTCTICIHPSRAQIEAALLNGESLRKIGKTFSVSTTSLFRHKTHVSEILKKAQEIEKLSNAESLKQLMLQLIADARRVQQAAEAAQDYRTALAGIRELTRLVELAARLSGALNEKPETKILNIHLDAETAERISETFLARRLKGLPPS